jgi:hypothetical protein
MNQQALEQRIGILKRSLENQREQFRRKVAASLLPWACEFMEVGKKAKVAVVNAAHLSVLAADALLDALGWTDAEKEAQGGETDV